VNRCLKRSKFADSNGTNDTEEHGYTLLPQLVYEGTKVVPEGLDEEDNRIRLEYNQVQLPEDLKLLEEDFMLLLQTNPDGSYECKNGFQKQSKSCDNPCDDSDTYHRRRSVKKTKRNSVHTDNE
jgi:hypothetical protein